MNKIFEHLELSSIPFLQIIHRLGYPSESKVNSKEKEMIHLMIKKTLEIWKPKAIIKEESILKFKKDQIICHSIQIKSHDLFKKFEGIKRLSFIAVTSGKQVIDYKDVLTKNNEMAQSVVLDAVLSEFTDSLADEIQKQIEREAALKGFRLTNRFSPGYGDLNLSFQKTLLSFLEAEKIGISINESFLMIPEKSITALIGWLKK